MREEIQHLNEYKVRGTFTHQGVEWNFNPPAASHFGGVWERLIRSVRKILYSLLKQRLCTLNDESLPLLLCEVKAILNGRPITKVSEDPSDLEPLTPNHLLLLRTEPLAPTGPFTEHDCYSSRHWKQIQFLADQFWIRWVKEYLPLLQVRPKWHDSSQNVNVGDVVLVVDNVPRNSYSLTRVVRVFPDKHDVVRSAEVKAKSTVLHRPINKLCSVLEGQDV